MNCDNCEIVDDCIDSYSGFCPFKQDIYDSLRDKQIDEAIDNIPYYAVVDGRIVDIKTFFN